MSDLIKKDLFKNALLMQALDASLESKEEKKVTYDGKTWRVEGANLKTGGPEKLNFIQAAIAKLFHKLHVIVSPTYAKRFDATLQRFEEAKVSYEVTKTKAETANIFMAKKANLEQVNQELKRLPEAETKIDLKVGQLYKNRKEQKTLIEQKRVLEEGIGSQLLDLIGMSDSDLVAINEKLKKLQNEEGDLLKEIEQLRQTISTAFKQEKNYALRQKKGELEKELAEVQQLFPEENIPEPKIEEVAAPAKEVTLTLNEPSLKFLEAVERQGSPELREVIESLITSILNQSKQQVIEKFEEGTVTFKETIYLWMPGTGRDGQIKSQQKGAIFIFGNNKNKEMKFTLNKGAMKATDGWDIKAPLLGVGKIAEISTDNGKVTITAKKSFLPEISKVRPLNDNIKHWLTSGKLVQVKDPANFETVLDDFLDKQKAS